MSPDDDDLDFDLESALDAWEQDFEDHAQAEAAPMPQEAAPKPASPPRPAAAPAPPRAAGRPLYRPDPELLERAPSSRQAARPAAPARPAPAPAAPVKPAPTAPDPTSFASFDDDDDEADSTRIAAIPQELIASLQAVAAARDARDASAGPRPAEPPPSTSSPSPPRGIDLDLDDLFDDLETRNGGEPALPAPTPAAGTPSALALTGELTDLAAPAAPAAPELAGPELAGPDLADEVHDPFSAERSVDDEDDEALVLPEHAPRSKPPSAPAPAIAAKRAEEDDAKAPPRPMPATPRMPPVPRPAAGWKPPAPPALLAKGPVAPRAETPRAEASAAPGQGGADHAAGSQPASADGAHERETPIPRAAEDLARPFADLELDDLAPTTASIEPDDDLVFSVDSGARVDEARAPALTAPAADLSRDEPNLPAKDESEHSPEADREEPDRSRGPNDDEPDLSLGPDDDDDPGLSLGPNDDEPDLSLGADDDDEPGLSLGSDEDQDDDEPDLSLGPDDDAPSHRGPVAPATTQDRGAAAASRTVRHRKPRDERFPYVGRDAETARRRAALLLELADRREGVSRARLASAAAELFERVGATEDAQSAYTQALDADPRDVVALRALRRDALHREDYGRAAELLELEVALPLSESDRAAAALLLAELQITHLGDPAAAERSARTAYDAAPSVAAGLLLVEACVVQGRALEAFVAWQKLAERWADPNVRATIWTSLARTAERGAQRPRAEKLYALAAAEHPSAVAPWLGLARLRTGRPRAEALASLASLLDSPPLAEGFRRAAATHLVREEPAAALALVDGAVRAASLRTRARAARLAGDAEALIAALEALAAASGGTERALALVDLAEARAARGDLEGADVALRDAALADEGLDTVRVVREVLARRAGDPARLAQSVATPDDLSTLSAVAQVAHAKDLARERELLATARDRGEAPLTADLVILDAAAEAGDDDAVADALRRAAERRTPERRAGPMLALAALLGEGTEPARGPLEAAVEAHPHPVTLAALARNVGLADPRRASELWELLAADLRGDAAYHAWTMAGRLARAASDLGAARGAFERASDELPGPTPAVWALEADAADVPEARALVHERVAATAPNPRIAVEAAVAAAITRGDGESFARVLEQTDALGLSDPALDAAIANIPGFDPATSAARAESLAARAEAPGARRYYQMRAALAHELAGDARAAAVAYRAVTEATPDPIALASLDRVELLAGEHARVADRRFEAVRDASDPAARVAALEALARFDRVERDDLGSAVLTLRTIREEAPGHLPTLRALARYDMSNAMDDELLSVASALSEQLPLPSALPEAVAASRLAARLLAREDAPGDAADALLLAFAERLAIVPDDRLAAEAGDWLLRHLAAVPGAGSRWSKLRCDDARPAWEAAARRLAAAEAAREGEGPASAADVLAPAQALVPRDPVVAERLGVWLRDAGEHAASAEMLSIAAAVVGDPIHAVRFFYDAGRAFEDAGDTARAIEAYEAAAMHDVRYGDLFDRARRLLEAAGDEARLAGLVARRVDAGADTRTLVELHEAQAELALSLGERARAIEALKAALALEPQRLEALRRLARVSIDSEDWRGAAEALIRIARLRQDRDELRWVFFTLGDIYDRYLPDPKRADAAWRRVLKLVPDDLETLDRLAALHEREHAFGEAIPLVRELHDKEIDPDDKARHLLRLARAHENAGDARSAEQVLDHARKDAPTDLVILRAMADLYERQGAPAARAMHLGRAAGDFRRLLDDDPISDVGWAGLVEVLDWKQRPDAARACASVAVALGVRDVALGRRLDAAGGIPGAGAAVADADLRDAVAPKMLARTVFEVFRLAGEAFDKAFPFDTRAWRAEKLPTRGNPLRDEALEIARLFGIQDVQLLVTSAAPRLCVPVGDRPATLLLGNELAASTTPAERAFLFARALAVCHAGLSVAMRSQPEQLSLLVAGLLKGIDPLYAPADLEARALEDAAKRIGKAIPRKNRDPLGPLAIEMAGAPGFDARRLAVHAAELGDRLALLALGTIPAALGGLLALAGAKPPDEPSARAAAFRKVPEAWGLVRFAISDAHFDARQRAGADRR